MHAVIDQPYQRTGWPALGSLATGIGLVALGAILGDALHQLLSFTRSSGATVQSVFTAIGLGVLTHSLDTKSLVSSRGGPSGHRLGND